MHSPLPSGCPFALRHPSPPQLSLSQVQAINGLQLWICDEADRHDQDFSAPVKVLVGSVLG